MLYRQKFDTFIRKYENIGYITNKADFSDRVCNESGAVFLLALSREPQSLEELLNKIIVAFNDVTIEDIRQDVVDFYRILEEDGFIVSGETPEELDKKDIRFSYFQLEPKTVKENFTPKLPRAEETTQFFFDEYFKQHPHLMNLQMELTSRCNERCIHCYIPHECKNTDIKPELFYSVLDQCREMCVLELTLSGGEPMLHPQFLEFVKTAKNYDFSLNILSNLTLLNDEIVNVLKISRISSVQTSLYSMIPEIHDKITTIPGSWQKTYDGIMKLVENDIPIQISCPVMKQNKDSFSGVLRFGDKLRVRVQINYSIMAKCDNTTENLENRLSVDEVGDVIEMILKDGEKYKNLTTTDDYFKQCAEYKKDPEGIVCGVGISSICMVANGGVYPCAGWQNCVCGNLYEKSLKDIWENSPKINWLRNLRNKDFKECADCKNQLFCSMCMVRNANENPDGDPLKINRHFCDAVAKNREIVDKWAIEYQEKHKK